MALTKTKYLTFGIEAESMRQAKPRLAHIENDLLNNFRRLGVIANCDWMVKERCA